MRTKTVLSIVLGVWVFLMVVELCSFLYYLVLLGSTIPITLMPATITYSAIGFKVSSVSIDSSTLVPIFTLYGYDPVLIVTNPTLYWNLLATSCSAALAGGMLISAFFPIGFLMGAKEYESFGNARKGIKLVITQGSFKAKMIILFSTFTLLLIYSTLLLITMVYFQIIYISIVQRFAMHFLNIIPLLVLFLLYNRLKRTIQSEVGLLKIS
ncbi:MAG: hypothetical protein QW831_03170 [Candidatus Jordarchaeaceae archaeon]